MKNVKRTDFIKFFTIFIADFPFVSEQDIWKKSIQMQWPNIYDIANRTTNPYFHYHPVAAIDCR